MKIIILAAGKGERLMPLTRNLPKPLIKIKNEKTLLEIQIDNIKKSGVINEIIIVAGYLVEKIEEEIKKLKYPGMKIKIIYNPFYQFTNNLVSLWISEKEMNDDFLITNGDNIFSSDVFTNLVNDKKEGIVLTTSKKNTYQKEDMKVIISKNKIIQVSKTINSKKITAESPGLAKITGKKNIDLFRKNLNKLVRKQEKLDKFWLEIFNEIHKNGVEIENFEIDGEKDWREIDYHPDLEELRNIISKNLN
jgi:choline kinase